MDDPLRYPIGKFAPPTAFDRELVTRQIPSLAALPTVLRAAVDGLTPAQFDTPYRDGGWTVRQVVHHLADSHGHAVARTRLALTEDKPSIAGYSQDDWVALADARTLEVEPSLLLLTGLHWRWTALLASLDDAAWQRSYFHTEYQTWWPLWKVAALYEWHGRHHTAHITTLRQRNSW